MADVEPQMPALMSDDQVYFACKQPGVIKCGDSGTAILLLQALEERREFT
jgi:hypothetical protein